MIKIPYFFLVCLFAACATGSSGGPTDTTIDDTVVSDGDATEEGEDTEEEGDAGEEDAIEDPATEEDVEDAVDAADIEVIEEDIIEEDVAEEDGPDPCDPNPCTDPPPDECVSATSITEWISPGTCTPSGSGYVCDYTSRDVDCSATNDMVCLGDVCTNSIGQVRAASNGPVSFSLRKVSVTYVIPSASSGNGFYIQRARAGPGLFMHLGSSSPTVEAGNLIDVEITNVTEYHGLKEADAFTITSNDGVTRNIGFLVQDFTGDGVINEDTESELILVNNAQVVSGWVEQYCIAFGSSSSTFIYYNNFSTLTTRICPGMAVDILAPAREYDGTHKLTPHKNADFIRLDSSGCGAFDNSNWDFEDWSFADPPEDFEKLTGVFTAAEETATVNNGSRSAALTWTSTNNQDFCQAWFTPAASGTAYTFHFWFHDNDTGGRGRAAIAPYDATLSPLSKSYGSYTSDDTTWRELTLEFTPSTTGFIRPFVRLYDVAAGWDGNAAIDVDDWALTVHTAFNVTNGIIDAWTATDPASPALLGGTPGTTMEIYGAINDEGVFYMAANEATAGMSDHFLYIWIGEADPTATVPAPWSKSGTIAAPASGSHLFVFIQEESNGFCELRRWNPTIPDWIAVTSSCGYDGTADGSGYMEAVVDLVSILALARVRDLPGPVGFAVAPYITSDGGALHTLRQVPACVTCNANVEFNEVGTSHRALILVGNVKP